ncbi:MAG: autotransporter-associated beta strand repeat-containing protein [Kiritimatiellia bacterium]
MRSLDLSGTNAVLNLNSGSVMTFLSGWKNITATENATINGPGEIVLKTNSGDDHGNNAVATGKTLTINARLTGDTGFQYYSSSEDALFGTIVLAGENTYTRSTYMNALGPATLQFSTISNKGVPGNLGSGTNIVFGHPECRFRYVGTGETTDRVLDITSGGILEHAGSGTLVFTAPTEASESGDKTLTLRNFAAADGEMRGAIVDGSGTVSIIKQGDGTWLLSAANTFSGSMDVEAGVLKLSGSDAAVASASSCSVSNGATLLLDNTAAVNNTDRLNDSGAVTLLGGTLDFNHDAGATDFSESAGALTAGYGTCTVQIDQAAEAQTSTLTFSSLSCLYGATLNFAGTGLGESDRSRVFITGQAEGPLGEWVTLNGQPAYYSTTDGVTTPPAWSVSEIAARGPSSVIPDNASADVRITQPGTSGPITLAGDPVNSVAYLRQCTDTAAEVDTANKTLQAYSVGITNNQAALTVGQSIGDGSLAPLAEGGTLDIDNDSTSDLTVNAALADHTSASSVAKYGIGNAVIAGPTLHTGRTEIHEGTMTFAGHTVTQLLSGAVSGAGTLVKTGTNILDLVAVCSGFSGAVNVNEGILRIGAFESALGTADGGTVIADGATLDVGGAATQDTLHSRSEPVTVQGAGADGNGVILNSSGLQQIYALGNVSLAGDATFGGLSRWDLRDGAFDMNNHSVTKTGPSIVSLSGTETVTPGGDDASIDVQEGTLRMQQSTQLGGSAANTVHLRSGTKLDFYQLENNPLWSLICEDGTYYHATSSIDYDENRWGGPVTLNGTLNLTFSGEQRSGFEGLISGTGSLLVTNSASSKPYFYITGTNNTYSGKTRVIGGWLIVNKIGNVGEPSSMGQPVNAEDAAIQLGSGSIPGRILYNGPGETTDREFELSGSSETGWGTIQHEGTGPLVVSNISFAAGSKLLYIQGGSYSPATLAGPITDSVSGNTVVRKQNSGTWILAGDNTYSDTTSLTEKGGQLIYTGTNNLAGAFIINEGILRLPAGAYMNTTDDKFSIRNNGAFYLEGGTFIRNNLTHGENLSIGHYGSGYGHLGVNSGTLIAPRLYAGWAGIGTTRFSGGEVNFTHYMHIGGYKYGTITVMPGGMIDHSGTTGSDDLYLGFSNGRGEMNMLGGVYAQEKGKVQIGNSGSTSATGVVNLCSGSFTTARFYISAGTLLVNFGGGVLRCIDSGTTYPVIADDSSAQVHSFGPFGDFDGGAVFDTNGNDWNLPKAIDAPTGQGVYSITVDSPGHSYVGEPYVQIEGDGYGACAVANMEDDGLGRGTYRVTGVTVTCPGVDYTTLPTVTFLGGGVDVVTSTVDTVTLQSNASGGLKKIGDGTLTISGANTYSGVTAVEGGTLKLGAAQALPAASDVVLEGGTLDLNGATVTNAVSGTGTLANGTVETVLSPAGTGTVGTDNITLSSAAMRGEYLADVTNAGACDLVAVTGDIDLSDFTLEIVDTQELDRQTIYTIMTCTGSMTGAFVEDNLPQGWHVSYQVPGTVRLVFARGTVIQIL